MAADHKLRRALAPPFRNPEGDKPVMLATTPPRTVRTGPWTVHLCVTAACTGCGGVPLDEDTGITPHFAGPDQAVEELTQEWGWYFTAFPARLGRGEELLCPGCAAAVGYDGSPWPPASHPDGGQGAGATSWEYPEQFGDGLPANTRCFPSAAGRTREEG